MRTLTWILFLLASACTSSGTISAGQRSSSAAAFTVPSLVLWKRCPSPCLDRSPRLAIYPDGTLIYASLHALPDAPAFRQAHLTRGQLEQLLSPKRMQAMEELLPAYFVSNGLHAPDHIIQWRTADGSLRQVEVNGLLEGPGEHPERDQAPHAFLDLFDALTAFHAPDATRYVPVATQVDLWALKSAVGTSVEWPASWPQPMPDSEEAVPVEERDLRAFLPGQSFGEVYHWIWSNQDAGKVVGFQGRIYWPMIRAVLPGAPVPLPAPEPTLP
ncbi:hypothetical protein [Corallococcus exercitus]|uniref:hypothetical protein n=1 Tax=Corallococcus exercitus TaxID=2316736 RepID=UPI0035D47CE1